jgi:hypothetical protein
MTESEVLFQISGIVNGRFSFAQAVEQIHSLLEREENGLDAFNQPYRSLYNVDLRAGGEILGTAALCFAADYSQGELPQRLANFVGDQLGMLLVRTRLAERNARLKYEVKIMEQDLAARKIAQRAEGLLVAKRGMTAAAASRWIAQQSEKTGLSTRDVADRIIAYDQSTGLLEQRIA